MKPRELKILLGAIVVIGMAFIIVGIQEAYSATGKTTQQIIQFNTFDFDGSSSLVSNRSYYVGGGPQFHLTDITGITVEALAIHPPADFNGSLSNVYFAVWESEPQPGSTPDQLIQANTLPVNHTATSNYLFFQLLSDEPLANLAPGSSWAGEFIYYYKIPENVSLLDAGTVAFTGGIAIALLASYKLVKTGRRAPHASHKDSTQVP